jgi:hypothetical protein
MSIFLKFVQTLALVIFLTSGSAIAQGSLPSCTTSELSKASNCWGRFVYPRGAVWVGEIKNGQPNGEGILYVGADPILTTCAD